MKQPKPLYLLLVLGLAACLTTPEPELSPTNAPMVVEPDAEFVIQDAEARGGEAAILYRNEDKAAFALGELPGGVYRVSVRARAHEYEGWPVMRLTLKGEQLGKDSLVKRERYGDGVQTFGEATLQKGQVITAEFLNDRFDGGGDEDRNLIIDHLILEPVGDATPPEEPKPSEPSSGGVTLPLEVIGPDGYVETATFNIDNPEGVDTLYLKAHRLAYRDASVNPERDAKGSVRLNGGEWVALSNETPGLECSPHEAAYGCLNGAYHTVRLSVPIGGAKAGENTLEFRFNGTDKLTSGYRVLNFNLLKGDQEVLPEAVFSQNDPTTWQPPLASAGDIEKGQKLWNEAKLADFPGGPKISATCSDCHAADGRDLQYFAYSNWAIQERSKFHGLSDLEGKQIASHIRSLDLAPHGRPWNPPYQPGPGLDDKPVERWAAGAGADAVLERDEEMLGYLFPKGTSGAQMREVIDKDATLNVREMPVSLQFPDWQAWLPEVHPLDSWGKGFEKGEVHHGETYPETYERVRGELEAQGGEALARTGELGSLLNDLATQLTNFSSVRDRALNKNVPEGRREEVNRSTSRWGAVKTWEVMQEFGLEDLAPDVFGAYGEPRSWLSTRRNVFELAPHRSAKNKNHFSYQSMLVGKYESTAWYQLQLTLNAGNRSGVNLWPVDWNYQPDHIEGLRGKGGGPAHPYRYLASHAKMYQQYDDGEALAKSALGFRQTHIHRYAPGQRHGRTLDTLPEEVRTSAYEALLNETVDVLEEYSPDDWERGAAKGNVLEPESYRLTQPDITLERLGHECHTEDYANCWYSAVPYFREAGVDEATLERVIGWGERIWPANDWEALKP